jgi:hypothetical protein
MSDENTTLVARAHGRVRLGVLPRQPPTKSFAGKGSGKVCAVCDRQILTPDVEFELDFDEPDTLGRKTLWMHSVCNAVWDNERARGKS